jgi:hypothetical protein
MSLAIENDATLVAARPPCRRAEIGTPDTEA